MPLLKKNGQFLKKGGKLVTTNSAKDCDCCTTSPPPTVPCWICDSASYTCTDKPTATAQECQQQGGYATKQECEQNCVNPNPVDQGACCAQVGTPGTPGYSAFCFESDRASCENYTPDNPFGDIGSTTFHPGKTCAQVGCDGPCTSNSHCGPGLCCDNGKCLPCDERGSCCCDGPFRTECLNNYTRQTCFDGSWFLPWPELIQPPMCETLTFTPGKRCEEVQCVGCVNENDCIRTILDGFWDGACGPSPLPMYFPDTPEGRTKALEVGDDLRQRCPGALLSVDVGTVPCVQGRCQDPNPLP